MMSGVRISLGALALSLLTACPGDDVSGPALSEGETGASDSGEPGVDSERDLKSIDASLCVTHPASLLATFTLNAKGQYVNNSGLDGRVLCPLIRDRPDSEEPWRVDVTVVDASVEKNITCTAVARDLQGDVVTLSASKSSADLGAQTLSLELGFSEPFAYHYVDCTIPRENISSGGSQSGIGSLVISEVKTFESVNEKTYAGLFALTGNDEFLGGEEPVIDQLDFAEVYFPESEGVNTFVLPIIRDNPDANPLRVRVHYLLENGAFITCAFISFYDSGFQGDLSNSAISLQAGFGTLDIAVPLPLDTDGPCALSCTARGPAAVLAYDVEET